MHERGTANEDYQLGAVSGAARGSELGLDEGGVSAGMQFIKSVLGAARRSAHSY